MEDLTGLRSCKACTPGMMQPSEGQMQCLPCPSEGVDCTVQDAVSVSLGWYRSWEGNLSTAPNSTDDLQPYRCPDRDACLGGASRNDSSCERGHGGPLCGVCQDGYYRRSGKCNTCDSGTVRRVQVAVLSALFGLMAAFCYMYARLGHQPGTGDRTRTRKAPAWAAGAVAAAAAAAARAGRGKSPFHLLLHEIAKKMSTKRLGTIGKVLLAYFQVMQGFSQIPSIRWPDRFSAYLDQLMPFSFSLFSAYQLECFVQTEVTFFHELVRPPPPSLPPSSPHAPRGNLPRILTSRAAIPTDPLLHPQSLPSPWNSSGSCCCRSSARSPCFSWRCWRRSAGCRAATAPS